MIPRAYATKDPAAEPRPEPTSWQSVALSAILFIVKKYSSNPRLLMTSISRANLFEYSLFISPSFTRPSSLNLRRASDADCLSGTMEVKYCAKSEACSPLGRCTMPVYDSAIYPEVAVSPFHVENEVVSANPILPVSLILIGVVVRIGGPFGSISARVTKLLSASIP